MRVAIQGTHGAFSEAAAREIWPAMTTIPCREASAVVIAVREGKADAGCLPIENSLIGSVTTTYDLLQEAFGDGLLRLDHEVLLPIHHALMTVPAGRLQEVRRVLSHPVALGQCRNWLAEHLPEAELVNAWDTAGSAEIVARDGNPRQAAVGPRLAADRYGLAVLDERIEDDPTNQTRFLTFVLQSTAVPAGNGPWKTSMIVWTDHRPGMLAAVLQAFAARGINLSSLQSRPVPSAPWRYGFYIDVEGGMHQPPLAEALAAIESVAARVIVLGSYLAWTGEGAVLFYR